MKEEAPIPMSKQASLGIALLTPLRGRVNKRRPKQSSLHSFLFWLSAIKKEPHICRQNKLKKSSTSKLKIATWNIRTLLDTKNKESLTIQRRTAVIAKELEKYDIDIIALQETHLNETGTLDERQSGYTFQWSGCPEDGDNKYGVASHENITTRKRHNI